MSIFVLVGINRILRQELLISAAILDSRHLVCPFCNHSLEASLQARQSVMQEQDWVNQCIHVAGRPMSALRSREKKGRERVARPA
jgi:hypothetical protein